MASMFLEALIGPWIITIYKLLHFPRAVIQRSEELLEVYHGALYHPHHIILTLGVAEPSAISSWYRSYGVTIAYLGKINMWIHKFVS